MMTQQQQADVTESTDDQLPLDDAGDVTLPTVEVLTGRGFITGKSGSGKSNSASVVIEELLDRGFPVLIVDTDGEYWGLKEAYEILHVGADEECDLQIGPEHAGKLAQLALEENVPIILDISGFLDEEEANDLVRETARELFQREKKLNKPFLLLVEEVHEFIPEGGSLDETGRMLIRVAKRGRKRGLGMAGVSQRPADVKKDFITQCDWLMWHRFTWENDTKVVRNVVGSDAADAVQDLADGEAFLQADFIGADLQRVQVRRKRTFDAGATPGLDDFERPDLQSVSGDLVDELEEISEQEERRQDRIAQLEQRVDELQAEKADLEEELESARDMRNLAQQMAEGLQAGGDGDVAQEKVDDLIEERNRLRSELEDREQRVDELESQLQDLQQELDSRPEIGERAVEAVEVLRDEFEIGASDDEELRRKLKNARERIDELEAEAQKPDPPDVLEHPAVRRQVDRLKDEIRNLDEKETAMLEWYKFYGPGSPKDAYFHAGGSRQSSHVNKKNSTLKEGDLIEKKGRGEYAYRVDEKVRETFADNPQIDDDAVDSLVNEVESVLQEREAATA